MSKSDPADSLIWATVRRRMPKTTTVTYSAAATKPYAKSAPDKPLSGVGIVDRSIVEPPYDITPQPKSVRRSASRAMVAQVAWTSGRGRLPNDILAAFALLAASCTDEQPRTG
jgi:hypothetical protein